MFRSKLYIQTNNNIPKNVRFKPPEGMQVEILKSIRFFVAVYCI